MSASNSPPSNSPNCPNCGRKTVLRTARRGHHAGSQFWGCSSFFSQRQCRGTRDLDGSDTRLARAPRKATTLIPRPQPTVDDDSDEDLKSVVRRISADGLLRTEEELLRELLNDPVFRRRGKQIDRRITRAIRAVGHDADDSRAPKGGNVQKIDSPASVSSAPEVSAQRKQLVAEAIKSGFPS